MIIGLYFYDLAFNFWGNSSALIMLIYIRDASIILDGSDIAMSIVYKEIDAYQKIDEITNALKQGAIMVYPTETLYGLGCDAYNENAYNKLLEAKKRPSKKTMLLLISSLKMALNLANNKQKILRIIANQFWPGPLTVLIEAKPNVPPWITNEENKIAFRISNNKFTQLLIKKLNSPIISTSANISGSKPSNTISEAIEQFSDKVDIYIDAGKLESPPSTIIDISQLPAKIIREGLITKDLIIQKLPNLF